MISNFFAELEEEVRALVLEEKIATSLWGFDLAMMAMVVVVVKK